MEETRRRARVRRRRSLGFRIRPGPGAPRGGVSKTLRGRRSRTAAVVAASVGVAALTLFLPSIPSYDAWIWAIWGKEIVALDVGTGTTRGWKPLPVAFATLFAPFGDASPHLWVLVARIGGVLALVFAYRLAARLAGPIAGVAAAVGLALSSDWLIYLAHGLADPLAIALVLAAIERHLDGRRDHTFALLFAAALVRPEVSLFLAPYGALVWVRHPARRPLVAAALVALPILWLGPDWWRAGAPFTGKGMHGPFRPSPEESPTLVVLDRFRDQLLLPLELAAVVVVALAVRQRERVVLVLAVLVVASVGLVAAMAERGFTGNPRYLLPAAALVCVLAGIGIARALASLRARWGPPAAVAFAVVALPFLVAGAQDLREQADVVQARVEIQEELAVAVERAGGADAVRACLPLLRVADSTRCERPAVNTSLGPRLAWELGLRLREVTNEPKPPALVFRAPEGEVSGVPPPLEPGLRVREIAAAGEWKVLAVTRSVPSRALGTARLGARRLRSE